MRTGLVVGHGPSAVGSVLRQGAALRRRARSDLIRLLRRQPGLHGRRCRSSRRPRPWREISYQEFLLTLRARSSPDAIRRTSSARAAGTTSAWTRRRLLEAAQRGSVGFDGLGLTFDRSRSGRAATQFHFPDGNASHRAAAGVAAGARRPSPARAGHARRSATRRRSACDRLDDCRLPGADPAGAARSRASAHDGPWPPAGAGAVSPTCGAAACTGVRGRNVDARLLQRR